MSEKLLYVKQIVEFSTFQMKRQVGLKFQMTFIPLIFWWKVTYDKENVDIEMLAKKFETYDMTNPEFLFCRLGCERDGKAALLH